MTQLLFSDELYGYVGEDIKTGQCAIYRSVKKVIVNTGRQLTRQFSL